MKWLTPDGHYIHGKGIQPDTKIASPKYQSISVIQLINLILLVIIQNT